jgi:26S proteasome non-ATPase regulatory subunit 10
LKAGAETDKKDTDGFLAMDLAPDSQVSWLSEKWTIVTNKTKVKKFILQSAEREGIDL